MQHSSAELRSGDCNAPTGARDSTLLESFHPFSRNRLMALLRWMKALGKVSASSPGKASAPAPATRWPALEHLEDRVVPSTTNVSISITPNFITGSVSETLNATVK